MFTLEQLNRLQAEHYNLERARSAFGCSERGNTKAIEEATDKLLKVLDNVLSILEEVGEDR